MIVPRVFKPSDIAEIDAIFKKQPELGVPSIRNMIINGVIEDTDTNKVIAYGVVKLFGEAILILDKDIPKRDKAKALREVMKIAISFSRERYLEYLYLISNSESFSEVLKKKYGFIKCPGELLMLDLEGD